VSPRDDAAEPSARPRRKKKKRKRKRAPRRPGPAFASAYPASEELDELLGAFERGNYAHVREGARELAERSDDARVRGAALDLLRRISPDATSVYLLLVAVGLLVFLYAYYLSHAQ
jgi:hypothetical protein